MIKVYPVIHLQKSDVQSAFHESKYAFSAGADGVYITDRYNSASSKVALFESVRMVRSHFPDRFVGINIADAFAIEAINAVMRRAGDDLKIPTALWVDNMQPEWDDKLAAINKIHSTPRLRRVKLVGGMACRGKDDSVYIQDPVMALYETEWLRDAVDIVVTSGAGASKAPEVEKLKAMKLAAGDKPLAVSSGITIENIDQYDGIVDEVFIHRGFETSYGSNKFDTDLISDFVEKAHSL